MWQDGKQKLGQSCLTTAQQQSKHMMEVCVCVAVLGADLVSSVLTAVSCLPNTVRQQQKEEVECGCACVCVCEEGNLYFKDV